MELIALGIIATAGLAGLAAARRATAARERAWKHAAEVARLTEVRVRTKAGFVRMLWGQAGALSVRLEVYAHRKHETGTRIVVSGLQHAPDELSIRRESVTSAMGKAMGNREIVLGDPAFDAAAYLQGSAELACALLDRTTRRVVGRLLEGSYYSPSQHGATPAAHTRASLADGELRFELRGGFMQRDAERVSEALPAVVAVAARLVRPPDIAVRLARNTLREPVTAVRLANLTVLLERHYKHPAARRALERVARHDPSDEMRLRAALALGTPGWDTLTEIALSESSDDGHSARAIRGLGLHLSDEQIHAILNKALTARRLATAQACVESLGLRGGREVLRVLTRMLALDQGPLAAAAARALALTREAGAEAVLIEALHRGLPEVLLAVAAALGRIGTTQAVVPLREASERQGDDFFRRAARQAIAQIQSRVQGADPGQLSLSGGELGQVSLVEGGDARGRLTVPPAAPDPGDDQLCTKNSSVPAGVAEPSRKKETR